MPIAFMIFLEAILKLTVADNIRPSAGNHKKLALPDSG
jgi:hypothetical protein